MISATLFLKKPIVCNNEEPPWLKNEIRWIMNKKYEIFKKIQINSKSQTD